MVNFIISQCRLACPIDREVHTERLQKAADTGDAEAMPVLVFYAILTSCCHLAFERKHELFRHLFLPGRVKIRKGQVCWSHSASGASAIGLSVDEAGRWGSNCHAV